MTGPNENDHTAKAAAKDGVRTGNAPQGGPNRRERPIVLIGLMGAGKTSTGRLLAARLGRPFVDSDAEIENAAGCSIADIFKLYGEADFRDGERRVIARLLDSGPCVLATGGGAFMDETTRQLIHENALSMWLRADLGVLAKRTSGRAHRPLLNTGNPREALARLIDERYPIYAQADLTIDTFDESHDATVKRMIVAIREHNGDTPR